MRYSKDEKARMSPMQNFEDLFNRNMNFSHNHEIE